MFDQCTSNVMFMYFLKDGLFTSEDCDTLPTFNTNTIEQVIFERFSSDFRAIFERFSSDLPSNCIEDCRKQLTFDWFSPDFHAFILLLAVDVAHTDPPRSSVS